MASGPDFDRPRHPPQEAAGRPGADGEEGGGSSKVAFGTLRVEGKELVLTCAEEPPAGTQRRTKELLREVGLKMKVTVAVRAPDQE